MAKENGKRNATPDELLAGLVAIIVLVVPMFLVVVFPENSLVAVLFGNGRIFVFWAIFFGLVFVFRRKIDQLGRRWASRRGRAND